MSLPINPLAKLIGSASTAISEVSNQAGSAPSTLSNSFSKIKTDQTIGRLSAAAGTNLNGFASNALGELSDQASTLGGTGNSVQSSISGTIGSLQASAGAISNLTADISGSINKLGIGGSLATGLSNFAGQISKAAGQINNLLSLKRGANLPANGEIYKQTGKAIEVQPGNSADWRVRINAEWSLFNSKLFEPLEETGGVVFPYLPQITVSTKANYTQIDPIHNNYPFMSYKNSQVDEIQITGEFTAETSVDALYWIAATTFFKTATKMFFGQSTHAGNPPIICKLSGYGTNIFNNVPVIIKSFSVDLPQDVNYIRCDLAGEPTWVPAMSSVTVSVQPIYNRSRLRQFNLQDYASGNTLKNAGFI